MRIITNEELIIHFPKGDVCQYCFVFGGIKYAKPKWMLSQIPKNILENNIFIISPYNTSFNTAYSYLIKKYIKEDIDTKNISLIGFSAGAKQVQKVYSRLFKSVVLIDPSTNKNLSQKKYNNNTILIYNLGNWKEIPSVYQEIPILEKNILKGGGNSERNNIEHKEMVRYFFNNMCH